MEHPNLHLWVRPRARVADLLDERAFVHVADWYEPMKKAGLGSAMMRVVTYPAITSYARGRTRSGYQLMFEAICEQEPWPTNRLSLDSTVTDRFGDPLPRRLFQHTKRDTDTIAFARRILRETLEPWAADYFEQPMELGSHHLMGTKRMSVSAEHGVVDANVAVHGVRGLYVAGSSVFPTGGGSNPTLTLTALALRLGAHLKAISTAGRINS